METPDSVVVQQQPAQPSNHKQAAETSQTASEFIDHQLQLEADAREALPYNFNNCTRPLGSLRQNLFSCLTCNPPPSSPSDPYTPAGVCYSCSISCHGEHELVELFARRNFTCDCGTARLPATSPCTLQADPASGLTGSTHSQAPAAVNTYNQNFRNRFCGCGEVYDAHQQKGTMYQCIGLAAEKDGGCGEDWWHPECLLGLGRNWYERAKQAGQSCNPPEDVKDEPGEKYDELRIGRYEMDSEHFVPRSFPREDQIETLICYKCCNTAPWIKLYAGSQGFLPPLLRQISRERKSLNATDDVAITCNVMLLPTVIREPSSSLLRKRAAEHPCEDENESQKKVKMDSTSYGRPATTSTSDVCSKPRTDSIPTGDYSLIASDEDFRTRFCRCHECYPLLREYSQLLEEEENYEPSLSEADNEGGGSAGTKSLLDRGEAALSNIDRVRAIEGVMVYNHLKDKVKSFLKPFAESGEPVGADDIKAYFEKLRGDAEAIRNAGGGAALAASDESSSSRDHRKDQSGKSRDAS